jgi:hypothetical protein
VLEKLDEFKLSHGKLPLVGNGAPFGSPELLKTIGPELLEGLLFSVANWPIKGQEEFIERFKKENGRAILDARRVVRLRPPRQSWPKRWKPAVRQTRSRSPRRSGR